MEIPFGCAIFNRFLVLHSRFLSLLLNGSIGYPLTISFNIELSPFVIDVAEGKNPFDILVFGGDTLPNIELLFCSIELVETFDVGDPGPNDGGEAVEEEEEPLEEEGVGPSWRMASSDGSVMTVGKTTGN